MLDLIKKILKIFSIFNGGSYTSITQTTIGNNNVASGGDTIVSNDDPIIKVVNNSIYLKEKKIQDLDKNSIIEVHISKVGDLITDGNVICNGDAGTIKAKGSVSCRNIYGNVTARGDMNVKGNIEGNVRCYRSIKCSKINGNVTK